MNLKTVQTPALLLDLDKFTRNCNWMKEKAERLHVALRPHLKTGKCIEFARTQMTSPSGPATISTLLEAEYFFNLGVIDLIYAVGISPGKFERAVNLREAGCDLKVILDNKETAEQFSAYCEERKIPCPVLIDIDDTLFDFRKSSYQALVKAFSEIGFSFGEQEMREYEVFNNQMWKSFELGEIEKEFIYAERFRRYFASIGLNADPVEINRRYLLELAEGRNFMPHCRELLQALHGKYLVVVVTNGDTYAQERRIEISGMAQYFDHVFISEQLGTKKPEKDFYDKVFQVIGPARREHAIMVGDSLSSDMQGGRNAGIPTCFYGKKENADERCDYVIEDLLNLLPILEND